MTECKDGFRARPWWVRWALLLQWLVIPALVFKGISLGVHRWIPSQARSPEAIFWHARGQQASKFKAIDCVFIGSSRVMAAVDEYVFAAELSRRTGRAIHPFNLGLAYSTVAEQYLLLRNFFRDHPEQMRGCKVFIEAPGGLPADTHGWEDSWCHPDRPDMLPPLLCAEDVVKAWTCGLPLEERLKITKDYFCRKSNVVAQRTRVATSFVDKGNQLMHRVLDRFLPPKPPAPPASSASADLTDRGGIRTDQESIARNRQLAIEGAKAQMGSQGPLHVSEHSVLRDLVTLVQHGGGRLVFFEMPIHPVQLAPLNTPVRKKDRKEFHEQLRAWGCYYVPSAITTGDGDFPDIWHLRRSLAAPFSAGLAKGWADVSKCERMPSVQERVSEANKLLEGQRDNEALGLLEAALKQDPDHPWALHLTGVCLLRLDKDLPRAAECLSRALAAGFDEFWARRFRGQVYIKQNRLADAKEDLTRAAEIRPADAAVRQLLEYIERLRP